MKLTPHAFFDAAKEFLQVKSKYTILLKESGWIVIGQIVSVSGSIFGVRLLTELLSPADYGQLAVWMTLVSLINFIVFGPLNSGAARFYSTASEQDDLVNYFGGLNNLALFGAGGVFIIALGSVIIYEKPNLFISLIATICFGIFSGYNGLFTGIQNAGRRRSVSALYQAIDPWLRNLIVAISILIFGNNCTTTLTGYSISSAFVLVSHYIFSYSKSFKGTRNQEKVMFWSLKIWKYSWPMAIAGITSWGYLSSQIWALELFSTKTNIGLFSVIIQIGFTPLMMIGGVGMTLLTPIIFSRSGDGSDKQKLKSIHELLIKSCLTGFFIVLVFTVISALSHAFIFKFLVADKYRIYSYYLPFVVFSAGVLQVSMFLATTVLASNNTKILLPLNTIGNSLIAAINMMATYLYELDGIFFAMVIGSIIHLLWNIYNASRVSVNN